MTCWPRVPDLTVIARTSSFAFKGKIGGTCERSAKALDATHLLEGSVQQSGLVVCASRSQLIRIERWRAPLVTAITTGTMADVFDVQDEVAT